MLDSVRMFAHRCGEPWNPEEPCEMTRHTHETMTDAPAGIPAEITLARVADLARLHPATIRVFQRHGIDFCCGGKRTLAEAASRAGIDPVGVAEELRQTLAQPPGAATWLDSLPDSLSDLGKLIVGRYHVALRSELPRLIRMADRVETVHGAEMPEILPPVAATVRALAAELEKHMHEEETTVFPAIERLEQATGAAERLSAEDLAVLVAAREDEHTEAGEKLRELRALTSGFEPPEWACNTFRGLYHGLAELELDLHEHIHLENNVLFPRALGLATQALGVAATVRD
jgi:regulator of cell morphogenesis and NO signaling